MRKSLFLSFSASGRHNMGPSPYSVMRNLTNAIPEPDKHLDVFAIGLGDASKEELDRISSSQRAEQRSFYLPDYSALDRVLPEASSDSCGIRGEKTFQYKRVFGGVNARDKQWPWQVLLKMKSDGSWKPKGGGSIISRRWVLTAAHVLMCMDVVCGAADVTVVAGITRRTDSQGSDLVVEEVIVHEMYKDNESYIYDIGLLKLKEDIVFGERKRPVCLPCTADLSQVLSLPALDWRSRCEHQDLIFTGRGGEDYRTVNGFVTGWGKIRVNRCMEDNLQYGSITVQSREKCGTILPDVPFTAEKLCANGNNVDACKGDSGGPFVIKRNGRWIQIGIVSYGDKDCTNGSTGFYVNVARMMEWIRGKVGEDLQFA
uniref:Plasma kallikrein-like n=1 Tax=Lepisosteus oculatus TaxID=7918 RepID=W5M627_LEPOC|nr:PREDICTED: plasma kallikrein-like [Lepisosteus oculatus]